MVTIRNYQDTDWESISRIHDSARTLELELAGLKGREKLTKYDVSSVITYDGK